ncbi:amino acid kinase family protein [Methylobrevis albus]|uniref:Uridylate kinase n=1 Tax=Methylobrevis albus TaxID=2793297 RepID=A0A931I3M3_9HYPH|nr:uridylate kinase [Methylobrevis albus]MBH0239642.1 uridylate kinase [Methylobrevis albus]
MTPARPLAVVKLGGSLLTDRAGLAAIIAGLAGAPARVVIIPGGGPLADGVRTAQAAAGFSDRLAHRLALQAMEQVADILADLFPACRPVADSAGITAAHQGGILSVWRNAAHFLRPGIPESWDVTSDSLAAALARELDANRLLLVKSAAPPPGDVAALARAGYVDAAFPGFAAAFGRPVHFAGPDDVSRIADLLTDSPRRAAS